ncbi:uncharacterized protein RJT20DRAFT_131868 [Scheffersomyces xylosifermentans]|uniref:uncharacterized protein n=1 Tax=Scheffersomyces xylosifermentans TaxID=1304137 RepID=UPI00315D0DF8
MIYDPTSSNQSTSTTTRQHSLRNSASVPDIRNTPKRKSPLRKEVSSKNLRTKSGKKVGFFKKVSIEFNLFLLRIKSISEEVFTTDELIDDFFIDQDHEETLEKLIKNNRGYTSAEEAFLHDFKKFKTLDKMADYHQLQNRNEEVKSSTTFVSDTPPNKMSYTLQDFIRQSSGNSTVTSDNNTSGLHGKKSANGILAEDDETDHSDDDLSNEFNEVSFHDIDLFKLRQELENHAKREATSTDSGSSKSTLHNNQQGNIGTSLWEYRRAKWLVDSNPQRTEQRILNSSIEHIPKDSYVKIYNNLVDKGRSLKNEKRINLRDLMKIINCGWIAEDKWERAAKGLP